MNAISENSAPSFQTFLQATRQFLEGPLVDTVSRIWNRVNKDAQKYVSKEIAVFFSPVLFLAGQGILNHIAARLVKAEGIPSVACKIAALAIWLFQSALYFAAAAYLFGVGPTAYVVGGVFSLASIANVLS